MTPTRHRARQCRGAQAGSSHLPRYAGSMLGRLEARPGLALILGVVVVALGALGTPDPFVIVFGIAGVLFGVYDIWRSRRG
jgi:hypothetical protein